MYLYSNCECVWCGVVDINVKVVSCVVFDGQACDLELCPDCINEIK